MKEKHEMQYAAINDNEAGVSTSGTEDIKVPEGYKREKYVALYQARTILAKAGTMEERRVCNIQLKRMKKLGRGYL